MPSKQVTDREKSTRAVVAAADTHAADIASGLQRELKPYLKTGETFPDIAQIITLVARKLHADNTTLLAADEAHEQELSDDVAPREDRDAAAAKVRAALVDLRAATDAIHGPGALNLLGIAQSIPVDASVIANTAAAVAKKLRDNSIKLPKAKRAGMKIDRAAFADEIDADLPALTKALAKVATEDREKETTQRAKNAAMEKHDATFSTAAGWLTATCTLAGLPDIADKIRPSARRPGRTAGSDDADPAATPPAEG